MVKLKSYLKIANSEMKMFLFCHIYCDGAFTPNRLFGGLLNHITHAQTQTEAGKMGQQNIHSKVFRNRRDCRLIKAVPKFSPINAEVAKIDPLESRGQIQWEQNTSNRARS